MNILDFICVALVNSDEGLKHDVGDVGPNPVMKTKGYVLPKTDVNF